MATMLAAERKKLIKEVCIQLRTISQEHPEWATGINFGVYVLATKYKLPKKDQPWIISFKRKTASRSGSQQKKKSKPRTSKAREKTFTSKSKSKASSA